MEVILLERVEKLGQLGDVVTVKDGYARNYLLPKKKALRSTTEAHAQFKAEREKLEIENKSKKEGSAQLAEKMDGVQVVMVQQAGEGGQLYGSVTARDIASAVLASGYSVHRNQVIVGKPIKSLGIYVAQVRLHAEVSVDIVVNVARSEEEAKLQAAGIEIGSDALNEAEQLPVAEEIFEQVPEEDLASGDAPETPNNETESNGQTVLANDGTEDS
tara:strand:+ start:244 stop:891 length:648 start_codon:yes stop_codon:yes gene_type:complete